MNRSLAQLGRQLLAIWKQLGLNQRISVALAAGVVAVGLLSLAFWSSRADYALLYGRLDDAEAAKVVAYLEEAKIPHQVGGGGGSLYVPRDKVHYARMQLASRGIPRGDGIGFEIFDKPNFGISDFVQRANYIRAMQGELARTIAQLDEVEAARVMIVMPENRLLVDNQKKPTASVFVRVKGTAQLPAQAVHSIRFLVANAVEGLQPNHVTVVDNRGHVLSEDSEPDSVAGLTSGQLAARRSFEQYLARKAEGMLEAVLGPGQAVVRVSADINFDTLTKTEEKYDPDGQVARSSTLEDENTDTTSQTSNGGVPGVATNTGAETNNPTTNPLTSTKQRKKTTNSEYEVSRTTSNLTQLAGGVKRLSAAVFVAARMEGTGAARKVAPRSQDELEKLRRIVQSSVGIQQNDPTRKDEITLEEMPFNDQIGEVGNNLEDDQKKEFWWQQVQNLIYPVLALGVFGFFWRLLKRTAAEELPAEPDRASAKARFAPGRVPAGVETAGGAAPEEGRETALSGVISPEAFNKLVRENPANFGQAIQVWLARGSPGNLDQS